MSDLDSLDASQPPPLAGAARLQFFRRIGPDWRDLAVVCDISANRLTRGYEAYEIWDWLALRGRLGELRGMLAEIGRRDLVDFLDQHAAPVHTVPEPDHNSASPSADLHPSTDLLGRTEPLQVLRSMVHATAAGSGGFVLVAGEPGIGKSSLLRAAADEAVQAGCRRFWAACCVLDRAFPLQPLLDALDVPGVKRPAGEPAPVAPDYRVDVVAAGARRVLDALADAEPAILVVDDLQWADTATLAILARLARKNRRLLIIGATRPVPRRARLAALRQAVDRIILVPPLTPQDVTAFVERAVGGRPSHALLRMAAGAAGNPLYLGELVDALARDGVLTRDAERVDVRRGAAPTSLSAAIAHRLDFLRHRVRRVLETAVLLGDEFPASELAVVTGRRLEDLRPHLDEATRAGVLYDHNGLVAFRHGLLRTALYEQIPSALRVAAHRDAARALAKRGAPVDRVARQLLPTVATTGTSDGWTARWLARTGHQLVSRAPRVAVALLRSELRGKPASVAPHDELVCRLAEALYRIGDSASAEEVAEAALEQVTRADLVVDLLWTLAQCRTTSGRSHEALDRLRHALESPNVGTGHRARLLVLTARVYRSLGDVDMSCVTAQEALTLATEADDRWAAGWALGVLSLGYGMRGDAAKALPLFDRALALAADQPALADLRLMLLVNRAVALSDLDRYQEAIAAVMQARTLAAEAGNRVRLAQAESVLVELLFDIGRWDAALRQVDGSSRDSADPTVQCCDHGVAAVIRLHRSDAAARRHLTDAEPFALRLGSRLIGSLVLARALDHEQAGAYNEALAVLYAGISAAASEVSEITGLLADAVRLAVVVGKRPLAEHLAGLARDCGTPDAPHRHAVSYHCRGLLDSDPTCLAHAAQEYLRAHRLLPCAQALEAAGTAAAERNDPGRARQYRANALSVYQVLHAGWDVGRLSGEWRQAA